MCKCCMGFWFRDRPRALETAWREAVLPGGDNLSRASLLRYLVCTAEIWEPLMGVATWLNLLDCSGPSAGLCKVVPARFLALYLVTTCTVPEKMGFCSILRPPRPTISPIPIKSSGINSALLCKTIYSHLFIFPSHWAAGVKKNTEKTNKPCQSQMGFIWS